MLRTADRRGKRRRNPRGSAHRRPGAGSGRVLLAASAVVLCLAALALLTWGTGGTGGGGRLAVGSAGSSADPAHAVPPDGKVTLVPLDGTSGSATPPTGTVAAGSTAPRTSEGASRPVVTAPSGSARSGPWTSPQAPTSPAPTTPGSPSTPSAPGSRPAHLVVGGLRQAAAGQRWCQEVTVDLANSGDLPVTSGSVTFATHVIGLLGVDWATIDTTEKVPVPIAGGQRVSRTWEICVDSWRVPLGVHIETRSVTLQA
ncbi:hypothetical protein [Streptomyces sp. RPT161]|uniref:hypothetical protein n=1 Tax=Streptomyces sp. RPT161 TaxID=3015993 RepID=UPI0022B8B51E|nr:hypothetical protein [Streptomyces sp. RPT161]